MSIFSQFKAVTEEAATESLDAAAVQEATQEAGAAGEASADPLQNIDPAFAQERQQAELNQEGSGSTEGEVTKTDVELPEGTHGEPAKITGDTDVKVDADTTDVKFDNIADEDDVVDGDDLDKVVDADDAEISMLMQEVGQLNQVGEALETYGMAPSTVAVMQISGLLSGTALESLGLESVQMSRGSDPECQMAIEALGEKIKEKSAAVAAKILHVAKSGAEKVLSLLTPLYNGVTGLVKKLTGAAWDAAKASGNRIKAHPYQTIAAVVAAMGVVAGIVMVAGGAPAMTDNITVLRNYVGKIAADIGKIKWPFGKLSAKVNPDTLRLTFDPSTGAKTFMYSGEAQTAAKLGWTQNAVKAIEGQLGRAWSMITKGMGALTARSTALAGSVGEKLAPVGQYVKKQSLSTVSGGFAKFAARRATGSETVGNVAGIAVGAPAKIAGTVAQFQATHAYRMTYVTVFIGTLVAIYKLVGKIIMGGLRIIANTFRALTGMQKSETAAA
jgi:ElaB/YqjD/DUF883 family membrane-anchored ribosome-binding protein